MSPKRSGGNHGDLYVLVIHRNPRERQRLARGLSQAGYTALEAEGRSDGLPITFRMRPNLIFLQIQSDEEESWDTFSHLRSFTDTPTVLLADKPTPSFRTWGEENAKLLIQPVSVAQAIAEGRALCAAASSQRPPPRPVKTEKKTVALSFLLAREAIAIDQALQEIGECGEVHLVMDNGRLLSLTKFKTEPLACDTYLLR